MSFSLSSLLNPSPEADSTKQPVDTDQRRESLPSISHIQSPDQQQGALPQYTPPGQHHPSSPEESRPLANSTAPLPKTWNGYSTANSASDVRPPSSGYDGGLELPPPPPASAQRQMSSPTLDQYHVSSRSPEQQRRTSIVSQSNAAMTLPPLQHVSSHGEDQARRQSVVSGRPTSSGAPSHVPDSARAESGSQAHAPGSDGENKSAGREASHTMPISTAASHPDPRESDPSPAPIKEEATLTPRASSPTDTRRLSAQPADMDGSTLKSVSSLKQEHNMRNGSPLRESSVPMPSTEDASNEASVSKKRPAPKKKGTATTTKKSNPSKKRKLDPARGDSPASRLSKSNLKPPSSKGTPAGSSPAPSNRSYSAEPHSDDEEEEEGSPVSDDLYCLCRRPDTGTFMIGCDGTCDDWFHGKCVGIDERDKSLIDKYMCPNCSAAHVGQTTWKRICRRPGCRLPARVAKSKNGKEGSKYCSDECGVAFFREMTSTARGRDLAAKNRASRRKSGHVPASDSTSTSSNFGARGGVLAAGEVRALLDQSKSLDDFKKLGEGVLSPPATPDSKTGDQDKSSAKSEAAYTEAEKIAVASITQRKEAARARHQLLKDRLRFVNMARQAAQRAVTERELKPKEYCGFDSRMEWGEDEFDVWRNSEVGRQALALDTLAIENSGEGDPDRMEEDEDEGVAEGGWRVCERKRCARHLDWVKLATDDVRFEMGGNGDKMRALDREERAIEERALLRGKAGGLQGVGKVVVHELPGKEVRVEIVASAGDKPASPPHDTMVDVGDAMEVDTAA